jgi:hypothetical protein
VQDKIGLLGDAGAVAIAGEGTTAAVLSFVEGFSAEQDYLVWSQVISTLGKIRSTFSSDKQVAEGLRQYTLKLTSDATDRIGWDFKQSDDYLTGQLRALLLQTAGLAGHESTVKKAQEQFKAFMDGDKKAIHPSLRSAVFKIAIKFGGKDAFDSVQKEYLTTTSVDGKEITLASMGQVQTVELAKEYLNFGFNNVAIQDLHSVGGSLGNNSKVRDQVWIYVKENWDMVREKLGSNKVVLERFLRTALNKFASAETEKDIMAFFKDKDQDGFDRGLSVVSDTIKGNAKYRERDMEVVREWLKAHGYAK